MIYFMKKFLILSLCVLTVNTACGNNGKNSGGIEKKNSMETTQNGQVIHLTKAEFLEKVYNFEKNPDVWKYEGHKPAIVDFYADWCGPCKMVAPILEELAKEYAGEIVVYKINTDKEQELSAAFGIRSIPSLLFIPMEGTPQMAQGAMPKAELKRAINEVLLGRKSE